MTKEFQTVQECSDRYFWVVKELSNTNQLIKVIIWLTGFCVPFMAASAVYIYSSLSKIELSLKQHEIETLSEIVVLKEQVSNLNKTVNN